LRNATTASVSPQLAGEEQGVAVDPPLEQREQRQERPVDRGRGIGGDLVAERRQLRPGLPEMQLERHRQVDGIDQEQRLPLRREPGEHLGVPALHGRQGQIQHRLQRRQRQRPHQEPRQQDRGEGRLEAAVRRHGAAFAWGKVGRVPGLAARAA
jgi:hypothetical protein